MAIADGNERTLITLKRETKEALMEISDKRNRTLSKQIQTILENYVAAYNDKDTTSNAVYREVINDIQAALKKLD